MPLSCNLGTLTSWKPLGHSRPVTGLLYLYLYHQNVHLLQRFNNINFPSTLWTLKYEAARSFRCPYSIKGFYTRMTKATKAISNAMRCTVACVTQSNLCAPSRSILAVVHSLWRQHRHQTLHVQLTTMNHLIKFHCKKCSSCV